MKLPTPPKEAIIYENNQLYACLASYPITKGHSVVVWKKRAKDLHLLSRKEYEHLMDTVDNVRNALLKALKIQKVYLMYMDEINQVHWHLVPRYNQEGFNIFKHTPSKTTDFSLAAKIKQHLE